MNKWNMLVIFIVFVNLVTAQNLVENGNFESMTGCPVFPGQYDLCPPWNPIPNSLTSPDYYNGCAFFDSQNAFNFDVPENSAGFQNALSGNAYFGIATFIELTSQFQLESREYITAPLTGALLPGVTYEIGFYVSRAEFSKFAIKNMGAYLSVGQLSINPINPSGPVILSPHIENQGGVLVNDEEWVLISGCFVAQGGENYITIGNFNSHDDTVFSIEEEDVNAAMVAYYYIEDVYVKLANLDLGEDTVLCQGNEFFLNVPSNYSNYLWSNGSDSQTIEIVEEGTYWLEIHNSCGLVLSDTIEIDFIDCQNDVLVNVFTPNGDGVNDFFIPEDLPSEMLINLTILNRWGIVVYEGKVGWDGLINGIDQCTEGVYFWMAEYSSFDEILQKHGTVNLIR